MKKLLLILALSIAGCSKSTYSKFEYNISENPWKDAFKDQVFFACLQESYNDPEIFRLIKKKDVYNSYDALTPKDISYAKDLAKKLILNIPKPTMCEGCKDGQNYYMAISLHYYKSRELDSIADVEFKKRK